MYQLCIIAILAMMLPTKAYTQVDNHNDYRTTYSTMSYDNDHTALTSYMAVYDELNAMLNGTVPLDFERAVFITENIYYQNRSSYPNFIQTLDFHTFRIFELMEANDQSDSIDFTTYTNFRNQGKSYTTLKYTEDEKRKLYRQALANWAIFTYLTDTLWYGIEEHLPFGYRADDPFALDNWGHSQVIHMLSSPERKGNCFAFAALFKIFSDRLNSDAFICTAPQHIYIQHRNTEGSWYNVELPTRSFPDDGTITTLTHTTYEGIMSGLAVRKLENTKQNVVLCLINLGKSYEHRFRSKESDFALNCAELALQYDSLNLNAWLLKYQIYQTRVLNYIQENNVTDLTALYTWEPFQQLEQLSLYLYDQGYREMPRYMQEIVLSKIQGDSLPSNLQDRTPNPFTSITVPENSRRYSTVSGGLYDEIHEQREIEQYGYFLLDTKSRHLVHVDTTYISDPLIDPVVFAWGVDPLAHKFPNWSPYAAFNDNPIYYIDPTGMAAEDWVKDNKTGTLQYDPNVNSQADIDKYDKSGRFSYVGETHTETTEKGTAEYRKDGSIFFSNRTEGYNRVWNNSNVTLPGYRDQREHVGFAVDGGLLVLPDYKNNSMEAFVEEYGYALNDGVLYDPVTNKNVSIGFQIHSHPAGDPNPSQGDIETAQKKQPNKPIFTIANDGTIWAVVGNAETYTIFFPHNPEIKRENEIDITRDELLSGKKDIGIKN